MVPSSNPGRAGYLSSWLCIYSAPNCSNVWSVQCSLWYCPANTRHLYNIYTTSAQRLRRWSNIASSHTNVLCLLGVHYKEPLKSFEIRVGHIPAFGLPSVAILPQCVESDVKQYSLFPSFFLSGANISTIVLSSTSGFSAPRSLSADQVALRDLETAAYYSECTTTPLCKETVAAYLNNKQLLHFGLRFVGAGSSGLQTS